MINCIHRRYSNLVGYRHETVRHGVGEYVRKQASTNGVESFWALIKRGHYGVYHQFSVKHLHRYVDEFATRYNTRDMKPIERCAHFVRLTANKRLPYSELIK